MVARMGFVEYRGAATASCGRQWSRPGGSLALVGCGLRPEGCTLGRVPRERNLDMHTASASYSEYTST